MNNVVLVEQWLLEKHIKVNTEWLVACFEWLLEQLPNANIQNLKSAVYKQWITEDLREMGCKSLPANITNIRKIMLTGKYILQINSLRDISQPAYGQLLKAKGDTGQENLLISAAPKEPEPAWKTQPKRMLYMEVTDGNAELHAMEYKPITQLDVETRPGTKILVIGPVEYRMGVLFLTNKNVQILGGHVESLAAANTKEQVLSRVLGDANRMAAGVPSEMSDLNTRPQNINRPNPTTATRINNSNSDCENRPHRTLPNETRTSERSSRSDSVQSRSGNSGQKRSFSNRVEDDHQTEDYDDAFFDEVDMDELVRTSQAEERRIFAIPQQPQIRPQVTPPDETAQDDFDFIADERMFEEEMENLMTSIEDSEQALCPVSSSKNVQRPGSPQIDWKLPFSYLSSVDTTCLPADRAQAEHITIKGFISTVTSQLRPHPTLGWQLSAKVNDGSRSLEVDISDDLLTELIGLTVKDTMKMKAEVHKNPQLSQKIGESVNQCQKSLLNMNGLMRLILVSPRPCLLKYLPFENDHIKTLANRCTLASSQL